MSSLLKERDDILKTFRFPKYLKSLSNLFGKMAYQSPALVVSCPLSIFWLPGIQKHGQSYSAFQLQLLSIHFHDFVTNL